MQFLQFFGSTPRGILFSTKSCVGNGYMSLILCFFPFFSFSSPYFPSTLLLLLFLLNTFFFWWVSYDISVMFPPLSLFPLFSYCSFLWFILILFVLFLLFCFLSVLCYIYIYIYIYTHTHTLPVPFYSFLSSVFCVLSFFIIVMLSFVTMCLCQFIWLFHCIILTFYCISLPSGLFCSNFSQFSLFLYPTWYKP